MKHKDMLVAASSLSILLMTFHFAQDALHARAGTQAAGAGNLTAVAILVVWLAGPLLLADRRSGLIIMLLGGLFAAGMPVLHFTGGADLTRRSDALFFVWGLITLGVAGVFSVILSALELPRVWRRPRPARGPDREGA
jgi:hypothetical protein